MNYWFRDLGKRLEGSGGNVSEHKLSKQKLHKLHRFIRLSHTHFISNRQTLDFDNYVVVVIRFKDEKAIIPLSYPLTWNFQLADSRSFYIVSTMLTLS